MVKTTVYLPGPLLARLKNVARDQDVSEAETIRRALDEYTARNAPRPTLPLFANLPPIEDWDEALRGFGED
jgi:hypothetical protein